MQHRIALNYWLHNKNNSSNACITSSVTFHGLLHTAEPTNIAEPGGQRTQNAFSLYFSHLPSN
jgi:hypothetical protein